MSAGEDVSSSGLNGRLRPRRLAAVAPQRVTRRSDPKPASDRPKRASTPSKVTPTKSDDLANKSDITPTLLQLCPYCDRKFNSKQNVSKHVRRVHISPTKLESSTGCLFCNHLESDPNDVIRHMVDNHPNHYFACLDCHMRFSSTSELAEHKLNVCEKQKPSYRSKPRPKISPKTKKTQKQMNVIPKDNYDREEGFNGIVISCELKPAHGQDAADIEDNITTNFILPPSKALSNSVIEKNAVIILDDIQWTKRIPSNFSFHNADADQILSRLGVVHKSPRTGDSTKKHWIKMMDEANQKFERCFDTSFYSKVASNVHENLSKFLDGSFNFNPDPENVIKTRKAKNNVAINTVEGFPILLASEQFTRNVFENYLPRAIAPKHKWKWDSTDNDKITPNTDQIKRDSHAHNCIITLVSSLDIWTQLCMRRKYEEKYNSTPVEKKTEKQNILSLELKEILESRDIPSTSVVAVQSTSKGRARELIEPPPWLGLLRMESRVPPPPAELSGEWVRPRAYVCCACGEQTRDPRAVSAHIASNHPNAQVQHYEIVGERLLNSDILKHLYVPPAQAVNRTRPQRGIRDCTKCSKPVSLEELHQHMLECAGDTPTMRRKVRPRPFGARRRRLRLPDNTIRKKIRKQLRTHHTRQNNRMRRTRPKIRTEVGDAETIRKMIADLPAKRHRVALNPTNPSRPQRNVDIDKQRSKIVMKRRNEDLKNKRLLVPKETSTFSSNESTSTVISNKLESNDEDDKPLKPTVARMRTRRMEALKSNKQTNLLNRVKGKTDNVEEQETVEDAAEASGTASNSGGSGSQAFSAGDHNSERSDVRQGSSGGRQNGGGEDRGRQSGEGGSNDGNDNGDKRNGTGNGGDAPHNIPPNSSLKHSIARLTSKSETCDKAIQFRHEFLLRLECSKLNQHGPIEHDRRFENEGAKTKLDIPPLSDIIRYPSDPRQRSTKPRKGLNACIAMLKNKLVEPCSETVVPGHVSVQCGPDDPVDDKCFYCRNAAQPCGYPLPTILESENDSNTNKEEVNNENFLQIGTKNIFEIDATDAKVSQVQSNDSQPLANAAICNDVNKIDKTKSKRLKKNTKKEAVGTKKPSEVMPKSECFLGESLCGQAAQVHPLTPNISEIVSAGYQNTSTTAKAMVNSSTYNNKSNIRSTKDTPISGVAPVDIGMSTKTTQNMIQYDNRKENTKGKFNIDEVHLSETSIRNEFLDQTNSNKADNPNQNLNQTVMYNSSMWQRISDNEVGREYMFGNIAHEYPKYDTFLQNKNTEKHRKSADEIKATEKERARVNDSKNLQVNQSAFSYNNKNIDRAFIENKIINKFTQSDHPGQYENENDLNTSQNVGMMRRNSFPSELPVNKLCHDYQAAQFINQYSYGSRVGGDEMRCYRDLNPSRELNILEHNAKISEPSLNNTPHLELNYTSTIYNEAQYRQIHPPRSSEMTSNLPAPLDLSNKSQNLEPLSLNDEVEKTLNYRSLDLSNKSRRSNNDQDEIVDLRVRTPKETYTSPHSSCYDESSQIPEPFYTHDISQSHYLAKELASSNANYHNNDLRRVDYVYGIPPSNRQYCPDMRMMPHINDISPNDTSHLRPMPQMDVAYLPAEYHLSQKRLSGGLMNINITSDADIPTNHRNLQTDITNRNIEAPKEYESLNNYVYDQLTSGDYPSSQTQRIRRNTSIDRFDTPQSEISISPAAYVITATCNQMPNTNKSLPIMMRTPSYDQPSARECARYSIPDLALSASSMDMTAANSPIPDNTTYNVDTRTLQSVPYSAPLSTENTSSINKSDVPRGLEAPCSPCNPTPPSNETPCDKKSKDDETKDLSPENTNQPHSSKDTECCKSPIIDQDPETAKKIALLPKELVEIIGTMPPDHRDQLLNVLPQFVSNSASSTLNSNDSNMAKQTVSPTKETDNILALTETKDVSSKQTQDKPFNPQEKSTKTSNETSDSKQHTLVIGETSAEEPHQYKENHVKIKVSQPSPPIILEDDVMKNKVIDLTIDDIPDPKISHDSVIQPMRNDNVPLKPALVKKPKSNNEQTASLRAVRIKTALERNKSQNVNVNAPENTKINVVPECVNDAALLNGLGISAVQQSEISSTQQNKKLKMFDNNVKANVAQKTSESVEIRPREPNNAALNNAYESKISKDIIIIDPEPKETKKCGILNKTDNPEDMKLIDEEISEPQTSNTRLDEAEVQEERARSRSPKREDEDSEDDVTLALIVQQKLKQSTKCAVPKEKKKRKKKSKVTHPKSKEKHLETDETNTNLNTESPKEVLVSKNNEIIEESKAVSFNTSKRSKKRTKKKCSHAVSFADVIQAKNLKDDLESQNNKVTMTKKDLCGIQKVNDDSKLNDIEPVQELNVVNKQTTGNKSSLENRKKRSGIKLKMSDILYRGHNENKTVSAEFENEGLTTKPVNLDNYHVKGQSLINSSSLTLKISLINKEKASLSTSIARELQDLENPANTTVNENMVTSTPLRRSRRGKSLFAENFEYDKEEAVDAKAHLTKKQLIFSKLLSDEENITKMSNEQKPLEVRPETPKLQLETVVDYDRTKDEPQGDNGTSPSAESKSLKRKKTSSKQKHKKSRSNDFQGRDCVEESMGKNSSDSAKTNHKSYQNSLTVEEKTQENTINNICTPPTKQINAEIIDAKSVSSAEKRKVPLNSEIEMVRNNQSKKLKTSECDKSKEPLVFIEESKSNWISEVKNTTCYSKPLASKRIRSKSVGVRQDANLEVYDPYDIDLDEMIEKVDEFGRHQSKESKRGKSKSKSTSTKRNRHIKNGKNLSKSVDAAKALSVSTEISIASEIPVLAVNSIACEKYIAADNSNTTKKTVVEILVEAGKPVAVEPSAAAAAEMHLAKTFDEPILTTEKSEAVKVFVLAEENDNDSDSSKSDVPLKSYVRMRDSKILADTKKVVKSNQKDTPEISKTGNCKIDPEKDAKEQRSEQFMESFGFFSERKPRKSNLIASKKISETFHVIANEREDIPDHSKHRHNKKTPTDPKELTDEEPLADYEPSFSNTKGVRGKRTKRSTYKSEEAGKPQVTNKPEETELNETNKPEKTRKPEKTDKCEDADKPEEETYMGEDEHDRNSGEDFKSQLKILKDALDEKKNNPSTELKRTVKELLEKYQSVVSEEHTEKNLSKDEALFLHCCELLQEHPRTDRQLADLDNNTIIANVNINPSHQFINTQNDVPQSSTQECVPHSTTQENITFTSAQQYDKPSAGACVIQTSMVEYVPRAYTGEGTLHEYIENEDRNSCHSDDVDSVTAKTILESEEVRTLENDLISGFKEAAIAKQAALAQQVVPLTQEQNLSEEGNTSGPISKYTAIQNTPGAGEPSNPKQKKYPEIKEKMYPDILIEDIDMYEDKFDKIKRKCRSQAAAAKQAQSVVESTCTSQKSRKKSDKKKAKKSKKNQHNTVLTKGALKVFDGIKVSVSNAEINLSAVRESSGKKKKKNSSKKKRESRASGSSSKYDGDHRAKHSSQKVLDVYEFMDNEDAELFEFRPSTLMERFKSMNNKDSAGTSRSKVNTSNPDVSSESGSDGDDFVYMSDDYVCSDDETENSVLSCELHNTKTNSDAKKVPSPPKRKDTTVDKSAVMGKIFKNNIVRNDKKSTKLKDATKPKANLDQLFDSLLQNEEPGSVAVKEVPSIKISPPQTFKSTENTSTKKYVTAATQYEPLLIETENQISTGKDYLTKQIASPRLSSSSGKKQPSISPRIRVASPKKITSPGRTMSPVDHSTTRDEDYENSVDAESEIEKNITKKYVDSPQSYDDITYQSHELSPRTFGEVSARNEEFSYKKQSFKTSKHKRRFSKDRGRVSSGDDMFDEASREDAAGVARQRARRKCTVGKQNVLAETWSSESEGDGGRARGRGRGRRRESGVPRRRAVPRAASPPAAPPTPGPAYWPVEDEHVQQHGWIVGDSHKKLVTMLAHAKGRKRQHDDRRLLD